MERLVDVVQVRVDAEEAERWRALAEADGRTLSAWIRQRCNAAARAVEFERPPRETYVRVTHAAHGYTLEPAVEWREGDNFETSIKVLQSIADEVARRPLGDQMERAHECAKIIQRCWPDRAYFVEVWQEGREGFAQVFQPFGVPRNR